MEGVQVDVFETRRKRTFLSSSAYLAVSVVPPVKGSGARIKVQSE
jgi:hypothetical protein